MQGALLYQWDLEEQRGEEGKGFKVVELREVLPKQTTCKMKTVQVQVYIQQ